MSESEKTNTVASGHHHGKVGFIKSMSPSHSFWFGAVLGSQVMTLLFLVIMACVVAKYSARVTTTTTTDTGAVADTTAKKVEGTIDKSKLRHTRGSGDVTIVEFSDTECPFCKRFHETLKQVTAQYEGKVQWAYVQFPLEQLHSKAPREANATECASEQGKFWEYIDLVFEKTNSNDSLPDEMLFTIADQVSLNKDQFTSCLNDKKYDAVVKEDMQLGTSVEAGGTPYTVLIDKDGKILDVIEGAVDKSQVTQTVDKYIK